MLLKTAPVGRAKGMSPLQEAGDENNLHRQERRIDYAGVESDYKKINKT